MKLVFTGVVTWLFDPTLGLLVDADGAALGRP